MDVQRFISFEEFVTPSIITIVYILGVVGITLCSLFFVLFGSALGGISGKTGEGLLTGIILAIIIFVFGNIILRVFCENLIILFKIHDHLESIDGYFKVIKANS